ncbi:MULTISPECIES: hypothetical protein [unclassified Streptomyces]|uniref:hypothetical protein n=2 Tax=unclassified Streptomyces TaxID=2593676 RepID=UPI002E78F5D8|nr:hypothetical protein [Streptomyces sp. JV184]MEE1743765.1 hypothetical protein [Streptomyces sp. JV184]
MGETYVPALLCLGDDSLMLNVTDAGDADSVALLLTTMHRLHKQLDDFTTQLYIAYAFGDESGLVPAVLIEGHTAGPELRLHHRFGLFAEGDSDVSELRFSAGVTVTSAGCNVEAMVDVDLEQPQGEFGADIHTLYLERIDQLSLMDALSRLEEQVTVLCTMGDIPSRLGFDRLDRGHFLGGPPR